MTISSEDEMATSSTAPGLTSVKKAITEEAILLKRGFVIADILGEGSYATVWSGVYNKTKSKCAIKVINRNKAPKDFLKKFLPREIKILKCVRHPNIIALLDVVEIGNKVYIAMELAGHGDMLEYIKLRGALKEPKAREFFHQLSNGINYMHERNFIHRDLKCENLLLDARNVLKISDFGFAREILPTDMSRTFCGSAAYAAPEILLGRPYIGTAYDVWSMGVILYIMVCGSMPYDDSNIKRMVKDQTEKRLGFSRNKTIGQDCKGIITCLLTPNPQNRATVVDIFAHPWMQSFHKTSSSRSRPSTETSQSKGTSTGRSLRDSLSAPQSKVCATKMYSIKGVSLNKNKCYIYIARKCPKKVVVFAVLY